MDTARHIAAIALAAFALLQPHTLKAQDVEPTRYEIEQTSSKQIIRALPVDGQGVVLFYNNPTDDSLKQPLWTFVLADTNLRETNSATFRFGRGCSIAATAKSGTHAALVFQGKPKDDNELHIVSLDRDNKFTETRILLGNGLTATNAALADSALLVAVSGNGTSNAMIVNLQNGTISETAFGQTANHIVFKADAVCGKFVVTLKVFEKRRFVKTVFVTLDTTGRIVRTDEIPNSESGSLGRYCISTDSTGNLTVLATLETEAEKKSNIINAETERVTRGVCFAKFADSTKIRNYMFGNPQRVQTVKKANNIVECTPENSKHQPHTCLLVPPQLTKSGNRFIFTGEAYTYEYRPETRMSYDFYGRSIPTTYYVFEGYNFYNTLAIAFDEDGTVCWSTNFSFENPISKSLESRVSCTAIDSTIIFASPLKNEIRYKMLSSSGSTLVSDGGTKIDLFFANDELAEEESCGMEKWFGNTYIMYGTQTIDNGHLTGKNRRKVFFIQRIDFK